MNNLLKITFLILFFANIVFGQGENNIWYLNSGRALDFNFSPPLFVEINTFIYSEGPKSSVSDVEGNLLFISNGQQVWDNTLEIMPNGNGLQGSPFFYGTMPVLSVPMPGQNGKYYLFTMLGGYNFFDYVDGELHYSILDMNLNEGKGDIISSQKNIFLRGNLTGRLIAAKGICGSLWVLVHEVDSNRFLAYEITEGGIRNPVITETGVTLNGNTEHFGDGMINFSTDFKRVVVLGGDNRSVEVFNFDMQTGLLSNLVEFPIETKTTTAISGCFSPDNQKLYIMETSPEIGNVEITDFYQFNLDFDNINQIRNSKTLIGTTRFASSYTHMQIGPDGAIYIPIGKSLSVIQFPNFQGIACNYRDSVYATSGSMVPGNYSLINPIVLPARPSITDSLLLPQDTQLCQQNTLNISISAEGDSYEWQDGSTTPEYQITAPGTYWVNVQKGNCTITDTLKILPDESTITIGNDTTICENESLQLQINPIQGIDYQWQDGSQNPIFTLNEAGVYWVESTDSLCSSRDSLIVGIEEITVSLSADTLLCEAENLLLTPNLSSENIQWQDGSTNPVFTVKESGTYWVELNQGNCRERDSVEVRFEQLQVDLPADTVLCSGEKLLLDLSDVAGAIRWQDGSTALTFLIENEGKYRVELSQNGCTAQDSIMVTFQEISIKLPNDTTICDAENLLLEVGEKAGILEWQDGTNVSQYLVSQSGQYWLRLEEENCIATDTINIEFLELAINLGADTTICEGESLTLDGTLPNAIYQWQNNATSPNITVSQSGLYWVKVAQASCIESDSILIKIEEKAVINLGNDTLFCEGESLQLTAPQIAGNYQWQNGSTDAVISINQSGLYWLNIQTENCLISDSILIEMETCEEETLCKVYIPNVFSPNNDGMNDQFQLFSNCELTEFSLEVYDRWGNRLFSTTDISQSWDGRMNNEELQTGVYLVKTNYRTVEQKRTTLTVETVTIIR